jgi:hypothetical protein
LGDVAVLSLTAALNPTLLTATAVMLLLPNSRRLMVGYWLGAVLTSITIGLVIVFALQDSSAVSTAKKTLSPLTDIALGAIVLVVALVLATGRDRPFVERRAKRKEGKGAPRWQRTLSKGTARTTFAIGALLTLPGASYLAGLTRISKLNYATGTTVLLVVGFNLVMLILLEGPLVAFALAPDWAVGAIDRGRTYLAMHGRRFVVRGLVLVGAALVIKGIVGLL